MIYCKTDEEVQLIKEACEVVGKAHAEVAKAIKPGVKSIELDKIAETYIRDVGAEPAFKGYRGFPHTLCFSVNAEVVHGMPNDREIQEGDILSIDCGAKLNEFFGDSAYTYMVGEVDQKIQALLQATKDSLYKGIEQAVVGKRLGDISFAVQNHTEKLNGYGVVRELVGHGLGRSLHESPEVPNYGRRGTGVKLKEGMVLAIEPMINLGTRHVRQGEDGWTIFTRDGKISAHYEHTIAVKKQKAQILSTFEYLKEAVKLNNELTDVN